jgi:hypothetical protein
MQILRGFSTISSICVLSCSCVSLVLAQDAEVSQGDAEAFFARPLQIKYLQEVHEHYTMDQVLSSNPETDEAVIARPNMSMNNQPVTATAMLRNIGQERFAVRVTTSTVAWAGQGNKFHLTITDPSGYPVTTTVFDGQESLIRIDCGRGQVSESRIPGPATAFHTFSPSMYLDRKKWFSSEFAPTIQNEMADGIRTRHAENGPWTFKVSFDDKSGELLAADSKKEGSITHEKFGDFVKVDGVSLPTNVSKESSGKINGPIRGIFYRGIQYNRLSNEEFDSLMKRPANSGARSIPLPVLQNMQAPQN